MNALILVGGYGTRLRPLTLTTPKPLVDFCNKAILEHQILNLAKSGVSEIILAIAYKPDNIKTFVNNLQQKYNVKIIFSIEDEPLGTGGPIKLAENFLSKYDDFFVFNSDIICSFPLVDMMKFHKENKSLLTIMVKEVDDPRSFGVVITDNEKKILKFEEKPLIPESSLINSGIYILNKKILNCIPKRNTSLEKEIFPKLASENVLYFYKLNDFWADIGKPSDFLKGQALYLDSFESLTNFEGLDNFEKDVEKTVVPDRLLICYTFTEPKEDIQNCNNKNNKKLFITFENIDELNKFDENTNQVLNDIKKLYIKIEGNVLISSNTVIKHNCFLGENVVLGDNVILGEGCRIKNSCILKNSIVNSYTYIDNSIIGSKSCIGSWSRIEGLCVLGENVNIKPELFINNAFILPYKEVISSIYEKGAIIM
ncbi:mannose-1-phosphate guanyltransferase, putative [Plasmodium chabaudi adami]|uniref:mannose-1-phosphate guanylyltransferase n=1 Tax=Plasmodium chabaudi adami TaxID=5826 RepID=A0A1D3LKG5_PLACE|nr:mannose-1-phosphate guanyltransferase, putative [Plasmodium chabaudi adami]